MSINKELLMDAITPFLGDFTFYISWGALALIVVIIVLFVVLRRAH